MIKHKDKSVFSIIKCYWLPVTVCILVAITFFSLSPLDNLPDAPGSDKAHHFIAYGALMFPVALRKPDYYLWVAVFFIIWSGGIELVQPYVNRYGEWLDLLANTVGLTFGFLLARLIDRIILQE